jgi:hypothetical protein
MRPSQTACSNGKVCLRPVRFPLMGVSSTSFAGLMVRKRSRSRVRFPLGPFAVTPSGCECLTSFGGLLTGVEQPFFAWALLAIARFIRLHPAPCWAQDGRARLRRACASHTIRLLRIICFEIFRFAQ